MTQPRPPRRFRMLWGSSIVAAGIIVAILIVLMTTVDDWRRDLTSNFAETSAQQADPRLRPLETTASPAEVAAVVRKAAGGLPRWVVVSEEATDGQVTVRLTRTTSLWRFVDDVTVTIRPAERGAILTAQSRSRVGRGDLGQNPRNLQELLDRVRRELP